MNTDGERGGVHIYIHSEGTHAARYVRVRNEQSGEATVSYSNEHNGPVAVALANKCTVQHNLTRRTHTNTRLDSTRVHSLEGWPMNVEAVIS